MALKYQKPFTIPEGFPEILKSFTREVLRSQVCARQAAAQQEPEQQTSCTCNCEPALAGVQYAYPVIKHGINPSLTIPPSCSEGLGGVTAFCCWMFRPGGVPRSRQAAGCAGLDCCCCCHRDVLQPEDLHAFGAAYFQQLAQSAPVSSSQRKGSDINHVEQQVDSSLE
jgi:hypothetical protein